MPFTLSHPAAVVPLARWLPLSALVAGAVAPDLYFLALQTMPVHDIEVPVLGLVTTTYAHTWPGIATFSLPIALCLWFLFHTVAKWPLIALFPPQTRRQLCLLAVGSGRMAGIGLLAAVGGVVVGLGTHLLWDASTHREGWVGDLLPILGTWVVLPGMAVRLDELLFILSSALGLVLLVWWWRRWSSTAPAGTDLARPWSERQRIAILTLGGLGFVLLFAWLWQRQYWPVNHRGHFPLVLAVVIALHQIQQGTVIAIMGYCLLWWGCGRANGGRPVTPPESW